MSTPPTAPFHAPSIGEALALEKPGELVSVVGGGGKSALLFALGAGLPGYTVLTTTTRIFAAQTARAGLTCRVATPELEAALQARAAGLLVIGDVQGDKALGVPVEVPGALLAADGVDFVVVEADGSRMLPTKAPAEHEPVVPAETTLFVVVAGLDALEGSIAETCHRPERVAALLGLREEDALDPPRLADLLCHPEGGLKGASSTGRARIAVLINKVETQAQWLLARRVAAACQTRPGIERVVLGALEPRTRGRDAAAAPFEVWLGTGGLPA